MLSRASLGLCALAATFAVAPRASADNPPPQIFDSVDGFQVLPATQPSTFIVTGILRGQAAAQTTSFRFYDANPQTNGLANCERYALIAMKDAGHFAFVVLTDSNPYVLGCRIERR